MAIVIVSLQAEITTTMGAPVAHHVANLQALAVPVFFVLSAYLFFEKLKKQLSEIWSYGSLRDDYSFFISFGQ